MPKRLRLIAAILTAVLSPYPLVAYLIGTQGRLELAFPILKAAGALHAVALATYLACSFACKGREPGRTVFLSGLPIWIASMAVVAIQILNR